MGSLGVSPVPSDRDARGDSQCPYCGRDCDRQHSWTVLDVYCGPGGVSHSLQQIAHDDYLLVDLAGVDVADHAETYPARFHNTDASDIQQMVERFYHRDLDLLWLSPPCQAYSRLSYVHYDDPKEAHPTFADLGVREVIRYLDPEEYIIENVAGCDDLDEPTRVNGFGVGEEYGLERWFETSFDCPDACDTGQSVFDASKGIGSSYTEVAEAKGVPAEWGKSAVRSAIPEAYIRYLLYHCPSTPGVTPPETGRDGIQTSLAEVSV